MKPFIPSWLNLAGLSQADFRVYCCLTSRADNATGIAWPKADTIADDCAMARNTVWKSIRRLEERGLLRRIGKPFQGSSRYQVLTPIGANGTPVEAPPTGANETPPIGANETLQSAQMERRECNPKKVIQRRVSIREISPDGILFAEWFKSTLPASMNLTGNWQETFAKAHDDLVRLDKRSPEEIRAVCQWARTDGFWTTNFFTPAKLRKRNGDGVTYFDTFAAKMKPTAGLKANFAGIQESIQLPT